MVGPALIAAIFITGLLLCFRLKFIHILHPLKVIKALFRPQNDGISPFRALSVALAGTLGVGNIAGVASAVALGGAGSVFWMWISALVSMVIKYGEIVLAMLYRKKTHDGIYHGGAFYYIRDGLGFKRISAVFAVLCIITSFTLGSIVQVKAAADSASVLADLFGYDREFAGLMCCVILSVVTACVVFGGIGWISDITVRLIPLLSVSYIGVSLFIIFRNINLLPGVMEDIVLGAFDIKCIAGGIGGYGMMQAVRYGVSRGLLSNEAGCGTAPIAHASSDETVPAVQGCFGIFEVFADTILLCSMTAFVILIHGCDGTEGITLALNSFISGAGNGAGIFLALSVICFAFATLVCWSYYGCEAVGFLGGKKYHRTVYLVLFCITVLLSCILPHEFIWESTDFTVGLMTVINSVCVCLLSGKIVKETKKL